MENNDQVNKKNIKVLRTYTSDMAEMVRDNEASVIKIALAEKEKRENEINYEKAKGTKTSKALWFMGGLILFSSTIFGLYFLATYKKELPSPTINNIASFISYDSFAYINTTNETQIEEILNSTKQKQQIGFDKVRAFFLTRNENGIIKILNTNEFFPLIKADPPGVFIRSLSSDFLFGKYSNNNINNENINLFLVFQTTDYNQTYAAMLDWEKTIIRDLSRIFTFENSEVNNSLARNNWKDIIIENRDTRIYYGETGQILLYYVFINKDKLLITNNLEALKEISHR